MVDQKLKKKEQQNLKNSPSKEQTVASNSLEKELNQDLSIQQVVRKEQESKQKELEKRKILWSKSSQKKGDDKKYDYKLINVQRVIKVTKGGRRFSFLAVALAGDRKGKVGYGTGKATEVSLARQKAFNQAEKNLIFIPFVATTIPHTVIGRFCGAKIILKPAARGTGIIVGGSARSVLELLGVANVRGKSLGSSNKANLIQATFHALSQLRTLETVQRLRGKEK